LNVHPKAFFAQTLQQLQERELNATIELHVPANSRQPTRVFRRDQRQVRSQRPRADLRIVPQLDPHPGRQGPRPDPKPPHHATKQRRERADDATGPANIVQDRRVRLPPPHQAGWRHTNGMAHKAGTGSTKPQVNRKRRGESRTRHACTS
jgi:hypothetical protein